MRKLLYFAAGFAIACSAGVYLPEGIWRYVLAAAAATVVCLIRRRTDTLRRLILAVLGCLVGFCWLVSFRNFYLKPVLELNRKTIPMTIRASDYGTGENSYTFCDGITSYMGKTYRVQMRLKADVDVQPGQQFAGTWYLRVEEQGIRSGEGVLLAAYQKGTVTAGKTQPQWLDTIAHLRWEIKNILKETFPEDVAPFAKALLLGDTSDLRYETDTDLKVSGIRHVVAVSGLHISIVFGLLSMVTFRRRFLTALVGYPLLFFFAALTGFTPSVVRSCLMWALVLLSRLADREYDGPTALSFAVLVMLAGNPLVITAVGFQLSVASVAGIFLFTPGIVKWLQSFFGETKRKNLRSWLIRWSTTSAAVTLGATVLTTPLSAYYFGVVSLVGVLTNLLALWIVSGIFYGIMAVCLLFPVCSVVAAVLAEGIAWPIRYVLWVAHTMAEFPLAAVYTVSPYITAWLVFVYLLLVVFLIMKNRRPGILACCAAMGLCFALIADWSESMKDDIRLTVLDVGQGQSLLFQSEGRVFVVDCGGDYAPEASDIAAEALLSQGIRKLDGLILTHSDNDHAGGAEGLLSRMETDLLILPEQYSDLPRYTDAQVICATAELEISFGETVIRIFPAYFPGDSNEKSLCILFDTEKCDILVTGDRDGFGERALLRYAQIPDVDVLIAGHHGADTSTCEELLAAVKPEIVCISAGAGNLYGHPAPELLQRLAAYGCDIYRTDVQGTITIRRR